MMRSLFAGVSGLTSHQTRMDVIGNNIANVNTIGFKKSRVTFQDMLSQTLRSATGPSAQRGGVNPQQVGLGVNIGTIDVIHTEGATEPTGVQSDLSIRGNGFFVLLDGRHQLFTRAGAFDLDPQGWFGVPGTGLRVAGWNADSNGNINTNQPVEEIQVPSGQTLPAQATRNAVLTGNLAAEADVGDTVPATVDVIDSLGVGHRIVVDFTKTGDNQWSWVANTGDPSVPVGTGTLDFDNAGEPTGPLTGTLNMPGVGGAAPFAVELDLGRLSQFGETESDITMLTQDGFGAGTLEEVRIDGRGVLMGIFSNGLSRDLAQLALATFSNNGGLLRAGETTFEESRNSGIAQIGAAGSADRGDVTPGTLEMSNVDLSEEFTSMIITQRGFQANSRIITTSDEMLQELVNLKR